ncbi:MAG TPA: sugar phosphate nucleotidyltransferase [Candidatus Binatia bacterium]|nr:sugar phosphate nucleotidyltransferase [Candidatus Binatia bacterium]
MKAVVMAGGEGARLRPLTSRYPKPMVPIVGTPVIEHNLRLLRDHGITEVVVTLQYLGAEIRNRLGDGSDLEMSIDYVVEDRPLGTAGSVRNAAHLLDDTFLIISADCLTDIDLSAVIEEHRQRGAMASLVLTSTPNPLEYGVVITDPEARIERFLEKPSWGEVFSDHVNTGIYVVEPEVLELIPEGVSSDWSHDVFPEMLRRRDPLYGIVAEGYWCDIGSIPSFLQANWDALAGKVRCRIPGRCDDQAFIGAEVEMGRGATIEGPAFLGDEVKLKAGTHLIGPVIVDKYAIIDDNASVTNSVVWPHAYIGEGCRIREAIIGRSVTVKNNSLIEEGAVIGDECVIGQGSRIRAGVKLWPHKEIEPGSTVNESVVWAGEWRRGLFSSYGMTGLINVEFTPEFCARLGAAFSATLPRGATISVARDQARSSRMIMRAVAAGMVSAGARVRDLDQLPVPVCQFATRGSHSDAGLHVLASPLDQRSADIRILDRDGLPIDKRAERRLENLFFREDFRRAAFYEMGDIEPFAALPEYAAHLLQSVDQKAIRDAKFRVLIDYDYSQASQVLPEVLHQLGVTTVPLNAGLAEGPHHRTVPDETALITRTIRADVGCLFNPTGERLSVIDDQGVALTPYELFAILVRWWARPGVVLAPASSPQWVSTVIEECGASLLTTLGEPAQVLRASAIPDACLATDGEGGFIWPYFFSAFDAMHTLVKLLELRAHAGEPLSSARARLPRTAYLTTTEFVPWDAKGRVMRVLLEEHRDQQLDLVDGIKVFVDGGFVLVRPDPDEPACHIVASVDDEREGRRLLEEYAQRVRSARGADSPGAAEVPPDRAAD